MDRRTSPIEPEVLIVEAGDNRMLHCACRELALQLVVDGEGAGLLIDRARDAITS